MKETLSKQCGKIYASPNSLAKKTFNMSTEEAATNINGLRCGNPEDPGAPRRTDVTAPGTRFPSPELRAKDVKLVGGMAEGWSLPRAWALQTPDSETEEITEGPSSTQGSPTRGGASW
ncbi:hypothetical protein QTO34_016466, partial [Cnephaeus nilssonii]